MLLSYIIDTNIKTFSYYNNNFSVIFIQVISQSRVHKEEEEKEDKIKKKVARF